MRTAFVLRLALLAISLALAGTPALAKVGYENLVKFRWAPVPKARAYTVQILEGEKVLLEKTAATATLEAELPPGKFGYRISTLDHANRQGPWSARKELVILPGPPLPSEGQSREVAFKHDPVDETLHWEEAEAATSYKLRVWQGEALLTEKEVSGDAAAVTLPAPGAYKFALASIRRGLQGPFGPEFAFSAVQFILAAPAKLLPSGRLRLEEGEKINLSWKKVDGADGYRVELRKQKKWRASVNLKGNGATSANWRPRFNIQGAESAGNAEAQLGGAGQRAPAAASEAEYNVQTFVTPANSLTVELPSEGVYVWKVRAIAGKSASGEAAPKAQLSGPEAQGDFELLRP